MRKEKERKNNLQKLIAKYEKQYNEMIVMDDYDGGQKESLRVVIQDLKNARIR